MVRLICEQAQLVDALQAAVLADGDQRMLQLFLKEIPIIEYLLQILLGIVVQLC